MQGIADSPQDHLHQPSLLLDPQLDSNPSKTPKDEAQSVTHTEVGDTLKELLELSNLYRQICRTFVGMDIKGLG